MGAPSVLTPEFCQQLATHEVAMERYWPYGDTVTAGRWADEVHLPALVDPHGDYTSADYQVGILSYVTSQIRYHLIYWPNLMANEAADAIRLTELFQTGQSRRLTHQIDLLDQQICEMVSADERADCGPIFDRIVALRATARPLHLMSRRELVAVWWLLHHLD